MLRSNTKRLITFLVSFSLLFTVTTSVANAAMIGTDTAVNQGQRAEYISEINDWLTREQVREQLIDVGVDPENAAERVTSMTDQELRTLHEKIENLPAGAGAIAVIGIVFLVLLILELVGITHVFSKF